jgi:trimeric autotransporter adhesin
VAGNGSAIYGGDGGPATSASLFNSWGVAVDTSGNVYIADTYNERLRMVTKSTGIITTIAYDGIPAGVAVDDSGNIYYSDADNYVIRMFSKSTGIISTVAGRSIYYGEYSGDGGQATSATFNKPLGVAVDASGNIYIADCDNHRIRMVTKSTGIISTVAGGGYGYGGDGEQATLARLYRPHGVAVDASGNIYIADFYNQFIRMVTKSTGIITTIILKSEDGSDIFLNSPRGVAVDASGNIYISNTGDNSVLMMKKSSGITYRVAGDGNVYKGDGGPAKLAGLSRPYGVAVDVSGNIYISDRNRIRMVSPDVVPITYLPANSPTPSPTRYPTSLPPTSPTPLPTLYPTSLPPTPTPTVRNTLPTTQPTRWPTRLETQPSIRDCFPPKVFIKADNGVIRCLPIDD